MRIERIKCWNLPELITIFLLLVFAVTGCPEAEQMVGPVITEPSEPTEEPTQEPVEPAEPPATTVGDEKQEPEEPVTEPVTTEPEEPTEEPEPEPTPKPVVTISDVVLVDGGAVLITGASFNLSAKTTITITVGDSITRIATTDSFGNWAMTVPATEVERLAVGTVIVTASVADTSDSSSFVIESKQEVIEIEFVTFYENVQRTKEMTEDSQVRLGDVDTIYAEVVLKEPVETPLQLGFSIGGGAVTLYKERKEGNILHSGEYKEMDRKVYLCLHIPTEGSPTGTFDLVVGGKRYTAPAEIKPVEVYPTRESIQREWDEKVSEIFDLPTDEIFRQFEKFFGFSVQFAKRHLINMFLEERPNDGRGLKYWQYDDIAVEYLYLQTHHPDTDEEGLEELLRESIEVGEVIINLVILVPLS